MLTWHKELWLIDHGAALYFHHSWHNWEEQAKRPFVQIKDHVLLHRALELNEVDTEYKAILTDDVINNIVNLIPDEWLTGEFDSSAEHRAAYAHFLITRIANSAIFVNEAQHAQQNPI